MARCRQLPSVPVLDAELLRQVGRYVERSFTRSIGDLFVHVRPDERGVELGLYSLRPDLHPYDALHDMQIDREWWAIGLVVHGRAHLLDQPDAAPRSVTTTYLAARGGEEVSLLRRGDEVTELRDRAVGRIPDLCRGLLGLP